MILCFIKQKTAYDMRISDWSSDVCSSDLAPPAVDQRGEKDRGKRDQCRFGEQAAGRADRIAFRDEIGRQPQQQPETDKTPGKPTDADRKSTRLNSSH